MIRFDGSKVPAGKTAGKGECGKRIRVLTGLLLVCFLLSAFPASGESSLTGTWYLTYESICMGTLELNEDGTARTILNGQVSDGSWTADGATVTVTSGSESALYAWDGETLTRDDLPFPFSRDPGTMDLIPTGVKEYLYGWEKAQASWLEIDGIRLLPVFYSDRRTEIRQILGKENMPSGSAVRCIRFKTMDGPADADALRKAIGQIRLYLYTSRNTGLEISNGMSILIDGDPAEEAVLLYGDDDQMKITGAGLLWQGKMYGLEDLRDMPALQCYRHMPLPEEQEQALKGLLEEAEKKSSPSGKPFHTPGRKVLVVLFDEGGRILETSLDAGGEDYHLIPAALLAGSPEEAEELILVYRHIWERGTYTDGASAYAAENRAVVSADGELRYYSVVTNYPPYSKSFRGHAYGVYDAYVAMEYVPEWILDCEAGLSVP